MTRAQAVFLLGLAAPFVGALLAYLLSWVSRLKEREKKNGKHTVIAEYVAPTQLSPAELGYIIDAKFGSNELLATIAELYAKGLVKLSPLTADDFSIVATDTQGSADDSESSVLGYLRGMPGATSTWQKFNSLLSNSSGAKADFEDSVLGSLVGKGLLDRSVFNGILQHGKRGSMVAAAVITGLVVWGAFSWEKLHMYASTPVGYVDLDRFVWHLLIIVLSLPLWFLLFLYIDLLANIYRRRDGIPFGATHELARLWPEVAGFQLFLQETEYVRLQHDRNAKDPSMAYCLSLGLDPGFIKSLK
jgi:hypothetical protein